MSQSPDKSIDTTSSLTAPEEHPEYGAEERQLLLHVAHESIEASLEGKQISVDAPTPHLAQHRGAFTSLYLQSQLRGCVGYVFPIASVYRTVMETARAAAFDDRRFSPLQAREAPHLRISLSILSPLLLIRAEDVVVGRHGLLVTLGAHRGLLLPQVPIEHHWDLRTFLEQTCHKAGLPGDAWRTGAQLEAFTAEVFGEAGTEQR